MSDIYPAEDLWLANNSMGAHLRDTILSLPGSEWEKKITALIEQMDDEGWMISPAFANCWASPPAKTTAGIPCASAS